MPERRPFRALARLGFLPRAARRILHIIRSMSRWEQWVLLVLSLFCILSFIGLLRLFYMENTQLVPTVGGTYIEGSVGSLQPLSPWFTIQNDVNRDIVSLVFAGLLKYNPQTRKIEEDLSTLEVSGDGKIYTARLRENLFWHDSTERNPHPVTADDVVFTFKSVQDPEFPNAILQQNFRGVRIDKIDARTVRFTLDQPYSFFSSNLILGIVPASAFAGIPPRKLDQALDFGFHPIGAGPYKVRSVVQTDVSSEVTLEKFDRAMPPPYRIERVVFRIYPDYSTLLSDVRTLQGVRLVARGKKGEPVIPKRFQARSYTLPQYVALFFNMERANLQDSQLRLGLQLGTNKQLIADTLHEPMLVDTPLLEIDVSDWRYQFDPEAAQGALFTSNWHLPEKLRLQHILEIDDANTVGVLRLPPVIFLATGASLTLSGSTADLPLGSLINGVPALALPTQTGSWIARIPTQGTGALLIGLNSVRVMAGKRQVLDSFYLFRAGSREEYRRALQEQALMRRFIQARGTASPAKLSAQDFFLEEGFLRERRGDDPVSTRRNERGVALALTLLTSPSPPEYRQVAENIKAQWAALGVELTIDVPASRKEFQEKMLRRDYDVLLFGQSLLDNLDSYPYWHSSGVQKLTGNKNDLRSDAYNLSQYTSPHADALLEAIRRTRDEKLRTKTLESLREQLKRDVPAIFLYSPLYTYAAHRDIQGIALEHLSLHSDRFLTLYRWYVKQERMFRDGSKWRSFFGWLGRLVQK